MILCLCPNPSVDTYVWVSSFGPGQVNRVRKEQRFPGGKGVHVALAAAELGEEVKLLAFWGGPTGLWIKNICEQKGIKCFGPELEEWTRTCLAFKDKGQYDDTELLGHGPEITGKDFKYFMQLFEELAPESSCITMSGSWPSGAKGDEYAQLIEKAKTIDKAVFLDCTGDQLQYAIKKSPYSIHLNHSEGKNLYNETNSEDLAERLSTDCELAALTAGADGLYLCGNNEFVHTQCHVDTFFSAVGSGDCLVAGLAVAYHRQLNIVGSAILATACGSANCIRPELGMLYNSDVVKLSDKVVVKTHKTHQRRKV